jgi:hypothetical protein
VIWNTYLLAGTRPVPGVILPVPKDIDKKALNLMQWLRAEHSHLKTGVRVAQKLERTFFAQGSIAHNVLHYVSQVHLRNFYSPALGDRMYAFRKSDGKAFTPNSESV